MRHESRFGYKEEDVIVASPVDRETAAVSGSLGGSVFRVRRNQFDFTGNRNLTEDDLSRSL